MKILTSIALIFLLFLTACNPTPTGGATTDPNDACSALEGTARDNCYFDERKCSKMSAGAFRDSCIVELAKKKQDTKVCDLIQPEQTKAHCIEQIAEITNDHDLCNEVGDAYWEDNCHFHLAVNNDKDTYCSLISNQRVKNDCFNEVALSKGDFELCAPITTIQRERCIYEVAQETLSVQACNAMELPLNKDACKKKVAVLSEDKDICNLISGSNIKEHCFAEFEE